ncbi:MAG: S8 family peptidase [Betaproteobacteria bacterium]|nr:S8 family peptidase [Betaproteobacteria bacterium]
MRGCSKRNLVAGAALSLLALAAARAQDPNAGPVTAGASDRITVMARDAGPAPSAPQIARIGAALRVIGATGEVTAQGEGRYEVRLAAALPAPQLRLLAARLGATADVLWAAPSFARDEAAQTQRIRAKRARTDPVPRTLIVRLKGFSSQLKAARNQAIDDAMLAGLTQAAGVGLRHFRAMSGNAYVLRLDRALTHAGYEAVLAKLAAHPEVDVAAGNWLATPYYIPNDTMFNKQWNLVGPQDGYYGIDAVRAWNLSIGSRNTVVAVVDTGVRPHLELADRLIDGYDFVSDADFSNDGDGRDDNGYDPGDYTAAGQCGAGEPAENSGWHGTHVAGTIGADGDNDEGVAGIDWRAKILPIRVLGACGGSRSDIVDGLTWAAGLPVPGVPMNLNPAKVINISIGGRGACDKLYQEAINKAVAQGAFIAVAAGNENDNSDDYSPASCLGVITVAATGPGGDSAAYSNYSFRLEISAPGGDSASAGAAGRILSTINSGTRGPEFSDWGYKQGTSMASPHVAGVASLMLGINPNLSPGEVYYILQETAVAFPTNSWCAGSGKCGAGILNARNATAAALDFLSYRLVYEFKNVALNHYFRTAEGAEARAVGTGAAGDGWFDTLDYFYAGAIPTHDTVPVCRFYGTPGRGPNSHFYTANAAECAIVKGDPGWTYEGIAFYAAPIIGGGCASGLRAVYRSYNGRAQFNDTNHRFTTSLKTQQQMVAQGWISEGAVFCVI